MTHWSNYLIEYLLRDKSILSSALDIMESNQNYGLYYPVTYWAMPEWVNHLLKNKHSCLDYLMRNGMTQDVDDFIPYPVGSMFIAKSSALEPLLKKNWEYDDFPSEPIPADGTFLHALERLLPFIVKSTGHQEFYYNPGTGDFTEDSSWIFSKYNNYNEHTLNHLLSLNDIISFDIFDTLAKREYAEPDYAKYLLPFRLGLNISGFDFVRVRNDVEYKLRVEAEFKGDVNIYEIYIRLVSELGLTHDPLELADLEFEIDLEMLSAKDIIIKILIDQNKVGKKIYIISDTYYMEHHIRKLLYRIGLRCKYELFVSSSLRIRKDDGTMWEMIEQYLRSQKKKDKFIHIGDNVCSDGQIPGDYGLRSFHILNPMDKWQACGFPRIKNVLSIDNPDSIHKWGQLVCQVGDDPFL